MTAVTLTTDLEAVNTMLSCINEAPVSTLAVSGLADVAIAKSILDEVSREVQTAGWEFNSFYNVLLARDIDGKITTATNVLSVDTTKEYYNYDVALRGAKLWWKNPPDNAAPTLVFDKDMRCDVVYLLEWNDLPQQARTFIMIRAARRFQARQLGSDTKHKFSEAEELFALANLQKLEANNADYSMLRGSWSVARILRRS